MVKPNNYFHVRVYTDDGSKIEVFRDRKQPSTRQEIVDGLKRAIDIIEKIEKIDVATGPSGAASNAHRRAAGTS